MASPEPQPPACRAVGLAELLDSREQRQARRQQWLARHRCPLLVLTPVAPGAVKDSPLTRRIFALGWQALEQLRTARGWPCMQALTLALPTGSEGYMALQADAPHIKAATIGLEEGSRLGRLWDMDVFTADGRILSRCDSGLPQRPCLLCGQAAKVCARQQRHSSAELLREMQRILDDAPAAC